MKDRLVAHRGDMTNYAENTLPAIQAAVDLGMTWVEIDIQLSKDRVPMVVHDHTLSRIVGISKHVSELDAIELKSLCLKTEPHQIEPVSIPTLEQVVCLLDRHENITLFVEVKKESVGIFGIEEVMSCVARELEATRFTCVVISFMREVAELARSKYQLSIGWVLTDFDELSRQQCETLQPDYIFCNYSKIKNREALWPGNWRWVLYDIQDPEQAQYWMQFNKLMIETGDITSMMDSSLLD